MNKLTELGKLIITKKVEKNISLSELATNIGTSQSYLSTIMYGHNCLSFKIAKKLYQSLNFDEAGSSILLSSLFNSQVVNKTKQKNLSCKEICDILF